LIVISALPAEALELRDALVSPVQSAWAGGTLLRGHFGENEVVLA